jgi:hypothetical protein
MTDTMVTYADGRIEVPKEVQDEMQLIDGTRLRLVVTSSTGLRVEKDGQPKVD